MAGFFTRDPMPAAPAPTQNPPNGQRRPLPITAVAPFAYDTNQAVGLITARNLQWGAWAITFDPQGPNPSVYDAPTAVGTDGGGGGIGVHTGAPRCSLSWGVAGILRTVQFDYPSVGGVLVLNANSIELSVRATNPTSGLLNSPLKRAGVGAWLTPSAAPSAPAQAQLSAGNLSQGPVPPFARYLNVAAFKAGVVVPACELRVDFMDTNLTRRWFYRQNVGVGTSGLAALRCPVPPWATVVDIAPSDISVSCSVFWELSFA